MDEEFDNLIPVVCCLSSDLRRQSFPFSVNRLPVNLSDVGNVSESMQFMLYQLENWIFGWWYVALLYFKHESNRFENIWHGYEDEFTTHERMLDQCSYQRLWPSFLETNLLPHFLECLTQSLNPDQFQPSGKYLISSPFPKKGSTTEIKIYRLQR